MAADPHPFEREMPEEVRAVLEQARAGEGIAVGWLDPRGRQIDASLELWRTGPPVVAGWLAGMAMFDDAKRVIAGSIDRERLYDPIPHLLDAFAAGIRAGVKAGKHAWGSIERLVVRNLMVSYRVPAPTDAFLSLLPAAVCAESTITREHAARIAGLLGEPAHEVLIEARARATDPRDLARFDAALGTFIPAPNDSPVECELLERLLVEWRACRDPALELPIQRLGRVIATIRGPLRTERKATSYYELEGIWQRRARLRDPGDLDLLLDVPLPWFGDAMARIEELAKHPPDPRLARLLDVAAASERGSEQLVDVVAREMAAHFASSRLAARLDTIERVRPDLTFATTLIRDATPTPNRRADPALVAEAQVATQGRATLEALVAQAARQPDDLAMRAVVADALEAAGDPRGELIGLQLAIASGATDRKLHKRATLLLDAHFATWTADLPGLARTGSRFERGFLTAARFEGPAYALALSLDAPSWGTVEVLDVGTHPLVDVIRHAPLLRAIRCWGVDSIEALVATGPHPRLRAIGTDRGGWFPDDRHAFPALAVIGGTSWQHGEPDELLVAMRRAVTLGLEAYVWFNPSPQHVFDCFDGSLELRCSVTSGRGGGFAPDGFAVRIPRSGAIQIAWHGSPDHTNLRFELTALVTSAHRLGRGPVEIYLAPDVEHRTQILEQLGGFYAITEGPPVDLAASAGDRT
ncbi:MAG: hypothetical protein WKG01_11685 [Kofleriaceae bacterium]